MDEPIYKDVRPEERTHIGYEHMIADDCEAWFFNGDYHRENGPAYIGKDGHKEYFVNFKRHRVDGPAVEHPGGTELWCLEGTYLRPGQIETMKHILVCDLKELPLHMNTIFKPVVEWRLKNNK